MPLPVSVAVPFRSIVPAAGVFEPEVELPVPIVRGLIIKKIASTQTATAATIQYKAAFFDLCDPSALPIVVAIIFSSLGFPNCLLEG